MQTNTVHGGCLWHFAKCRMGGAEFLAKVAKDFPQPIESYCSDLQDLGIHGFEVLKRSSAVVFLQKKPWEQRRAY